MANKALYLFYITIILVACSKTDNTKPLAELISPIESDTFSLNDTLYFRAIYSDNEELNQYRLEVKNNFTEIEDSLPAWKYVWIDALEETMDTASIELVIPDTIFNGSYFLITKCLDAEGNESLSDTVKIVIQ
jgi:hypothetical protein